MSRYHLKRDGWLRIDDDGRAAFVRWMDVPWIGWPVRWACIGAFLCAVTIAGLNYGQRFEDLASCRAEVARLQR